MSATRDARNADGWRRMTVLFRWRHRHLVWEAVETLDPLRVAFGTYPPCASVHFANLAQMTLFILAWASKLRLAHDRDDLTTTIAPCGDPRPLRAWLGQYAEGARLDLLGVGAIDFADADVAGRFQAACERLLPGSFGSEVTIY